jgi:hypothetical protein
MRVITSKRFGKIQKKAQGVPIQGGPSIYNDALVQQVKQLVDSGVDLDAAVQSVAGMKEDLQAALKAKVQMLMGGKTSATVPQMVIPWALT